MLAFRPRLRYPGHPELRGTPRPHDHENIMGRFDRRNSMKMKRRRAQAKKKARAKKRVTKPAAAAPATRGKSRAASA